jgi:hypothetical protein
VWVIGYNWVWGIGLWLGYRAGEFHLGYVLEAFKPIGFRVRVRARARVRARVRVRVKVRARARARVRARVRVRVKVRVGGLVYGEG